MWAYLPIAGFAMALLYGIATRNRQLMWSAVILLLDEAASVTVHHRVALKWQWGWCAIGDMFACFALAWPLRPKDVLLASLLGISAIFYLAIGAAYALGSHETQLATNYHAWWAMEYLAFAILAALCLTGFNGNVGHSGRDRARGARRRSRDFILASDASIRSAPLDRVARQEEYARLEASPLIQRIKNGG